MRYVKNKKTSSYAFRRFFVLSLFIVGFGGLFVRAVYLQLFEREFLEEEGRARHLRVVEIPAHRGMILDRNGELLAVSTPVYSVWANPSEALANNQSIQKAAEILAISEASLTKKLQAKSSKQFLYVKRHADPEHAEKLKQIDLDGIYLQREYRRYYPNTEVISHVLGFTDIDDKGLEGVELAYEEWLRGDNGAKKVIKDQHNRIVEDVEAIRIPQPGRDLAVSLDRRIQYLAYRELKAKAARFGASSASAVMLDVRTGEVLAMANVPSFNPNNRKGYRSNTYRNRAVTDVFEPGSTIKPFTIASALDSKRYSPNTIIHTSPGTYKVSDHTIKDMHNYGSLTVSNVILKSSNVGATKIALTLPAEELWSKFNSIGIGNSTQSGFPGEVTGYIKNFQDWYEVEHATMAFGYGMSMTTLQLARAYLVLASGGLAMPVTMLHESDEKFHAAPVRVFSAETVKQLNPMLRAVVSAEGTGAKAAISGYSVAGKTGTVHKSAKGGYEENKYISLFAGMAPASDPRLVLVVMVNEPSRGVYFGGEVAAPIFSKIMGGALRILNIAPDEAPLQATNNKNTNMPNKPNHAG